MSISVNQLTLGGNLTRDPDLRQTANATHVVQFSVAVNRRWQQNDEWREEVSFIECEAWGRQAENIARFLQKGSPVLVEGRLKQDSWTDREGKRASKLKVVANRVHFLSSGNGGQRPDADPRTMVTASSTSEPFGDGLSDDDAPF